MFSTEAGSPPIFSPFCKVPYIPAAHLDASGLGTSMATIARIVQLRIGAWRWRVPLHINVYGFMQSNLLANLLARELTAIRY